MIVNFTRFRFLIVLTIAAGIFAVVGCSPSPSEEEIRQTVQSEIAKLQLPEGEQGPPGEAGAQGARGESGEAGARGESGEAGARGESGEAGARGESGEAGARGESGEAGARGESGERGPRGEAGPHGPVAPTRPLEQIDWDICEHSGSKLECGFVEVPADYLDPEAGSINIAVNVHRATSPGERIGYLFVNPGGPGGSGVDMVARIPLGQSLGTVAGFQYNRFSAEIVKRFDIVGFDPRGVGRSEPEFACGDPGEQLALLATTDGDIDTPEETAVLEAVANLCIESMGPVGGLLHTAYVAFDMEEIRKALGAKQISYIGFSYGSTLGVWYASLFPKSVRAMVVDGANNPVSVVTVQEKVEQLTETVLPLEENLKKALLACDDPQCPIYNDGDPIGYYMEATAKLDLVNSAAGDNPNAGLLGVISTLYDEASWPRLWQGLFDLNENDDPTILLDSALIQYFGGDPTVTSFTGHVNCLDTWSQPPIFDRATRLEVFAEADAAVDEVLPLLAALGGEDAPDVCPYYDQFAPPPVKKSPDGGGVPILVIGNHDDTFTPFFKSEDLATETLSNGYLVETSHYKHVVYPGNTCVNNHIHRALIDGELPGARRVFCEEDRTFAPEPPADPEPTAAGEPAP